MSKTNDLRSLIRSEQGMQEIADSLPKHVDPDRWARTVLTCINKNPKLSDCTRSSFLNAMMDCSELGLEPNGREAHLIPYGNQCQLIVDYKGLVKLAYQSGKIKKIQAGAVYQGDYFEYFTCDHMPWAWRKADINTGEEDIPDSRGKFIGAYCIIRRTDDSDYIERMSADEIHAIRDRSKAGKSGPWKTDFDEMAKKTVFRRATKWIELSPHVAQAAALDFDSMPPINVQANSKKLSSDEVQKLIAPEQSDQSDDSEWLPVDDLPSDDGEPG
jgi:recombination protein RecT